MKRQTSRSRKERAKKGLVGLLTVSMCLSTLQGISFADSRTEVGGVEVNGRKITLSLSGTALRAAAEAALADATLYDDQYIGVSKDERTQAAYEALTDGSNPLYELTLFSDGEIAALEEAGVEVKALIQMDQEQAEANGNLEIATDSDITKQDKEDTQVVFSDPDKENEKELVLYRPGSLFGNFYDQFSNKLMHNAAETDITPADPTTYELNGEEKVTFLFINHADESRVFNIDLNGKTLEKGIKVLKAESTIKGVMGTLDVTGIPETKIEESTEAASTEAETTIADAQESIDPAAEATDATAESNEASDTAAENAGTSDDANADAAETTAPQAGETAEPQATLPQEGHQEAVTESAGESTSLTEAVQETLQQVMETIADATETIGSSIQETVEAVEETLGVIKSEASENSIASASDIEAPETETEADEAEAEENTEASKAETTAEAETARTDMEIELEKERKSLLRDTHAADLVDDSVASAKVLQYTLDDLSKSYWSAEIEGRYEVSVFAEDSAFAEPVQLELKELEKPAEAEDGTLETSKDTLTEQQVNALKAEGAYENSQSIDISFVNADGVEVEPASRVKVRIKVYKEALPEDADVSTMQIKHLNEKTETISVDTVAEYSRDAESDTGKIQAVDADGKTTELTEAPVSETTDSIEDTTENTAEGTAEDTVENAEPAEVKEILPDNAVGIESTFIVDSFSGFAITWSAWYVNYSATVKFVIPDVYPNYQEIDMNIPLSDININEGKQINFIKDYPQEYTIGKHTYKFSEVRLRRDGYDYIVKNNVLRTNYNHTRWIFSYDNNSGRERTDNVKSGDIIYVIYTEELTTVQTVDSKSMGFHIYIQDHSEINKESEVNIGGSYYENSGSITRNLFSNLIPDGQEYPGLTGKQGTIEKWFGKSREVNHLFVKETYDKTGYFEYNSADNFATLNDNNDDDFTVYHQLGTPSGDTKIGNSENPAYFYQRGNFMPFNTLNTSLVLNRNLYDDQGKRLEHTDPRYKEALYGFNEKNNYYFGLYATAEFYQPVGGQVNGQDMIYEFTGDDDMVVYIDGVLVLDLGGIHDAQSGYINFATGEVRYTDHATNMAIAWKETNIKEQFSKANALDRTNWKENTNTFADGSQHRIQIFYMERGAGASNLKLKVNIPPIPDGSVNIQKKVEGLDARQASEEQYTLQLFTKTGEGQSFAPVADQTYTLNSTGTSRTYKTDKNGQFPIHASDTANFSNIGAKTEVKVVEPDTGQIYSVSYQAKGSDGKPINDNGTDGVSATVPSAGHVDIVVKNDATENTRSLTLVKKFQVNGQITQNAPDSEEFANTQFELLEKGDNDKDYKPLYTVKYSDFSNSLYTFHQLDPRKTYKVVEQISKEVVTNGGTNTIPYSKTLYQVGNNSQETEGTAVDNVSLKSTDNTFIDQTVTFTNVYETPKVNVSFTKVEDGNATTKLSGAVFGVFTNERATEAYKTDGQIALTSTSDANGVVTFTGLPYDSVSGKTYYIKEITAPTGYVLSDAIYTVQITRDGAVSISFNGTEIQNNQISNTPVKLTFYKKANDSSNTPLEGATIKIEKKGENNTYQPAADLKSVDSEGKFPIPKDGITFNKIPDGEYRITEVTAPAGYNLLTKSFEFSISNGRLVQPAKSSDEQVTIVSTQDGAIDITIFNTPGRVLPGTGGMGTFLYNLSGLALMLTAMVYIIHARHRQKGGLN
ncbi:SpaA isopeptide-forming pilin-related protein [Oribacterium sp. HCP28S3_H8]|uniref:SpaA isopeptide-forming pilin-related protein n=1 Tax=Oribacterium sp. HCP28S3_H8 TaxID=3438945 RepID=UPI003F890A64